MYILEDAGFWNDIFRGLFALLDRAVYSLIPIIYNLIEDLAHVSILTMAEMDEFAGRIYTLLGLFMLFKVSFSIITYIINPDKMLDKQTGMQNIIKNVIIVLIMIISAPAAFQLLYDTQSAILKDQVIPKFILGYTSDDLMSSYGFNIYPIDENGYGCSEDVAVEDSGNYVALMVFKGFFQLEPAVINTANSDEEFMEYYCFIAGYNNYEDSYENEFATVSYYTRNSNIYNATADGKGIFDSGQYYVNYRILLSTGVGIIVLLLFVNMCFDVAVRSVKLTFLQLISPIPIISYIDPNSGKQGMFKKWITEVFRTWASLFIRLAAIYFAIYLIQELNDNVAVINNWNIKSYSWAINLFMIIGLLMFAKTLPSLLEQLIPGLKLGKMQLNPFKKVGEEALGAKQVAKTAGLLGAGAIGLTGAGIAHFAARHQLKKKMKDAQTSKNALSSKLGFNDAKLWRNKQRIASLEASKAEIEKAKNEGRINSELADRVNALKDKKIGDLKTDNTNIETKNVALKASIESKEQNIKDLKATRLYKNRVSGAMGSISRGALRGMKEGYKDPKHFFTGGLKATQTASEFRNYRDKYGIKDQVMDKLTDLAQIKNSSGTSDAVKKDIKKATDSLAETERNLEMLNRNISNLADRMGNDFHKAIQYDSNNRMIANEGYTGQFADELKSVLASYNAQADRKINLERQIKELENVINTGVPDMKK